MRGVHWPNRAAVSDPEEKRIMRHRTPRKLFISTEVLRTLACPHLAPAVSHGEPCYSRQCSAGEPCNDSRETCQ